MYHKIDCTQVSCITAATVSESIPVAPYSNISLQLVFASITGTQPAIKVQCSNDAGTSWDDIVGAVHTTTAAAESATLKLKDCCHEYLRVYVTTGCTTGTLNIYAIMNS